MEKPYPGRAIINSTFNGLEIIIPSKKSWAVTIFLFGWLGGWSMGEYFALSELIKPKTYSLAEAKHFRAVDMLYDSTVRGRRNNQGPFDDTGTIHFDYGLQTVQCASGISVAEAELIFEKLTQRGIKLNR